MTENIELFGAQTPDVPALPAIKKQVQAFRTQINAWAHQYYVEDAPTVPDAEYDRAYQALEALEAQYPDLVTPESPTQRVIGAVMDGLAPVRRHARRRRGGRERHAQHPHAAADPVDVAQRRTPAARSARRGVHAPRRF